MSNLPLTWIKGAKSLDEEKKEIGKKIEGTERKKKKNRDAYDADNEKKKLEKQLQHVKRAHQGVNKLKVILRPFGFIFGIVFFLLSALIAVSIFLTLIDRLINHLGCGLACGFILSHSGVFNPLDRLLVLLSHVFPLDYILLLIVILYLYLATLNGIVYWGIRLCCMRLYDFREQRTKPQGLLIASIYLMTSLLAIMNQLITIAPNYAMFGSQKTVYHNKTVLCGLSYYNNATNECVPTQVGDIVNLISLKAPLFGFIFFVMSCAFIVMWVIGVFIAALRSRDSSVEYISSGESLEI